MFGRGAPATPSAPWGKPEFAQSPAAGLAGLAAVNAGAAGLVQAELIQSQGQALLPAAPFAGLAAPQIMGQAMHAVQDRFAQHPQDGRPQGDQESFSDQQGQPQHEPPLSQAALWLALQEPSGVRPIPMPKPRPIEQDSFLSAGALQTQPPIWRGFSDRGQIPSSLPAQDGAPFISHPLSSLPLPPQPAQFTGWLKNAPAPDAAAATSGTSASPASSPTQTNPAAPAATASANAVEGTSAAAPKGPSADRNEIAALEMTLADPANKDMVAHFGGQLEPLPTWTTVGQGIEARYGADLGGRLYQLQKAQRAVEAEFFRAMDESRKDPPKDAAPSLQRPDQPAPTTDKPGWHYNPGGGHADVWTPPSWEYSPELFAQQYAKGESAAQKALASMYGPEPLKYVPGADTEVGGSGGIELDGLRLREPLADGGTQEGLTPGSLHVRDGWVQSGVTPPDHYLDPNRITKLNNNEFVWFDPVRGFMTDPDNLKESGLDKAFPYIMAAAFAAMGAGAVGGAVMNATGSAVAQGAAAGATGSLLGQYVATGHVNFKSVLTSALAGGLTAGVMEIPGVNDSLTGATSGLGKLLQYTGKATIQGAIQQIVGGKFKDGFVNSMLASAAQEVGSLINAEIANTPGLTDSERSAMRLLSRATTSAMRIVGSNDPAAGFANDFLGGIVGDALENEITQAGTDPLGDFIEANEQRRLADLDRRIAEQLEAAEMLEASLDEPDLINVGGPRAPVRNAQINVVRNGGLDSALNLGADAFGILGALPGLQTELAKLSDINARNAIDLMRQRMREAGMPNVPTQYAQALVSDGRIVNDYGRTVEDLHDRYERFVEDRRLRETWGDNYAERRIGKSGFTVQQFERKILAVQQDAVDRGYEEGRKLIAAGEISFKPGQEALALGNYADNYARFTIQRFGDAEGVSNADLAVNRRRYNPDGKTYGIPDQRTGANLLMDTTIENKTHTKRQLRNWANNPSLFVMVRPTQMGGAYVIPSHLVKPLNRPPRGL